MISRFDTFTIMEIQKNMRYLLLRERFYDCKGMKNKTN